MSSALTLRLEPSTFGFASFSYGLYDPASDASLTTAVTPIYIMAAASDRSVDMTIDAAEGTTGIATYVGAYVAFARATGSFRTWASPITHGKPAAAR
ncbi:hypothetical protein SPRG_15786 [Saprolegnia parasitica CBS 223.65]|uniref:Uncharacterized protein n=1 Tax=Saprolegnia parasitica (strain CBS 223.65) TaxID=695850 RepID=A0A067BK55_SAPPC|nr:hypothetical protein SPRG_15786 [Saprolegnia parasitica CBS 223.65]KDO18839.1 hypothetical protein SPRG_15786 [Saprolegnia parasitica CBS 223.65]|eukprot:XP_012210452.1 hypothetical protein SPRG_15786 [Saprolegnia parasitica CBS 223.65]